MGRSDLWKARINVLQTMLEAVFSPHTKDTKDLANLPLLLPPIAVIINLTKL